MQPFTENTLYVGAKFLIIFLHGLEMCGDKVGVQDVKTEAETAHFSDNKYLQLKVRPIYYNVRREFLSCACAGGALGVAVKILDSGGEHICMPGR